MLPGVLSFPVSYVLGTFSAKSGVLFSSLRFIFFYPIIKTTLLQNTTAIPQLPCSADNLCKHSVFFKREIFEAGLELMFSLRCLVTNQGLMPEISVAENPKKLGRALDLIFFVFYCWQNNKQKSQNVIFFFFLYSYMLQKNDQPTLICGFFFSS